MSKKRKKRPPKGVLVLPNLEQSKAAVLSSLKSKSGERRPTAQAARRASGAGVNPFRIAWL